MLFFYISSSDTNIRINYLIFQFIISLSVIFHCFSILPNYSFQCSFYISSSDTNIRINYLIFLYLISKSQSKQKTQMEKQQKILIKVTDPQLDATKNFVTYLISGHDSLGTFEIRRRFNDFFYFRESLKKRWPGLYIPPIPEKKINISGQDEQQMQYRRKFFDYFVKQLALIPHLFSCPITQQFLRNQSIVIEKYYQTVGEPRTIELIEEYKKIFSSLNYKETYAENKNTCTNFFIFLKKAQKQLKILSSEMGVIAEARANFLEQLNNCNMQMLPEYEKNVYAEYVADSKKDPVLLFVHDHKVQDNIRNLRDNSVGKPNAFSYFYDLLLYESRQIQAFQQAILSKQEQESNRKKLQEKCIDSQTEVSKLMGGKFSIKSIFSKGSKNEQIQILEKQIPDMQKRIQQLTEFCQILNCIQGTVEIPNFKKLKKQQYYETLSLTSEKELDYLGAYGEFMKSVMEGLTKIIESQA